MGERYDFMEAHIDDRFYMDFSRRREPDCWRNVYPSRSMGTYIGPGRRTLEESEEAATWSNVKRLYRLRVYLKRSPPHDPA